VFTWKWIWIEAHPLQKIRTIQTCSANLDYYFFRARLRGGNVLKR
jgi:hypothetical protein